MFLSTIKKENTPFCVLRFYKYLLIPIFLCFSSINLQAKQVTFVAEDLPPFHYMNDDNQPAGILVDIVKATMEKTDISYQIKLMPFARSFDLTLKKQNIFMFSLMKSEDRVSKFKWLDKIYKSKAFLVGLRNRNDININNLAQAKSYTVGTIRGYYSEKYLRNKGFTDNNNLHLSVNYKHMWHMLFNQRIDFVLTNFIAIDKELASLEFNKSDITPFIELTDFPGDLYIATGLATSDDTVNKLKQSLAQIKANGRYQKIINKWVL